MNIPKPKKMSLDPEYYFKKVERLKREGKLPGKAISNKLFEIQVSKKIQKLPSPIQQFTRSEGPVTVSFN